VREVGRFGFVLHPLSKADLGRRYRLIGLLPEGLVRSITVRMRPRPLSHVTGVRSAMGAEAEGWFVACPLLPSQLLSDDSGLALKRVVEAVEVAAELGAKIVGLGAFTAMVGDGGLRVAEMVGVAVTTGNTYTVAVALEGTEKACELMGRRLEESRAAVMGATGSIGRACAILLSKRVSELLLVGRDKKRLEGVAFEAREHGGRAKIVISTDPDSSLPRADVVVTVTSALDAVIRPNHLKPGAVVCDVARPRDVSREVAKARDDVLVIEGGLVKVPGEVEFGFDLGLPEGVTFACIAETMILALEGRYENYSLGRRLEVERVEEISRLAKKHGFRLAALRSFERALTEEEVARVRERAALRGG